MFAASTLHDLLERTILVGVAGARAISHFAGGIPGQRRLDFRVLGRIEITRMAAGAVRPVRTVFPGCGLGVAAVAMDAEDAGLMVAGIVGGRVAEADWRPSGRAVTLVALQRGAEVVAGFPGRGRAVVTIGTGAGDGRMIESGG